MRRGRVFGVKLDRHRHCRGWEMPWPLMGQKVSTRKVGKGYGAEEGGHWGYVG